MRLFLPSAVVALLLTGTAQAQINTYNGSGATITDASFNINTGVTTPATTTSTIIVNDTVNVTSLRTVTINGLTHTSLGDLVIRLSHRNTAGTVLLGTVDLANRVGQNS
ncbi:MAG: hypothetical protein H7Y38_04065, partial [Armatimonadetes bacterium]|nr:hypothetical protein [Armatimonadota bacterium]